MQGASCDGEVDVLVEVLLGAIAGPSSDAAAQARIACGSFYRVDPGDTLPRVATRAYGNGGYQDIVDAKRDRVSESGG